MFEFLKRIFGTEKISDSAIVHSSKGEYVNNRLKSGGHGQEALNYMSDHGITYNITKTYPNGVRIGNVPQHKNAIKRSGNNQSWFPKDWNRDKIKKAGQVVAKGKKYADGRVKTAKTQDVYVGIIRTKGKIATIFPLTEQKSRGRKK